MKVVFFYITMLFFSNNVISQIQVLSTDINSITKAGQGDLYKTTDTNQLYIGLSDGTVSLIGNEGVGGGSSGTSWGIGGNSVSEYSFLGTTNNSDLWFKVNNIESGRISLYKNSLALGYNSTAAYGSTLLGFQTGPSDATEAVGIGYNAKTAYRSVTIGSEASASNVESVGIGYNTRTAYQSTAIGSGASAIGNGSTAIGYNSTAPQANTIILGKNQNVGINNNAPNNFLEVKGATASSTSGLRLTGLGVVTPISALTNVLAVNSDGDVVVTNNSTANTWTLTGNSNASSNSFLGTTNDVKLSLRTNNVSILEFGKRSTLGLVQSYTDYTDSNQYLLNIKGNGTSALQFEASGANFYKPMFFTTASGNFRLKGSAGGNDFFELGSAGTNNDGSLEFIVGDDGNEPIVFKKYNSSTATNVEMMRLQGTGLDNNIRVGIKTYGVAANSTLQVKGSLSLAINRLSSGNITLDENHYTVILTSGSYSNPTIILPAANICTGRVYIIKNYSGSVCNTNFNYVNRSGVNTTALANGRNFMLQSDGTEWQLIIGNN
ncbi:hypothetical protein ACHRVZ_15680 [Flavobacterium sp. FlaQc-57]|uniref:hypothetical protein n=1 Tax=Flavobacterium sp. FlaQc-57 TaxID=3374186 RepID=UPI003757D3D5